MYGDKKLAKIAKSDIFVFPTFYSNECFPVVLLEAMQQGKPIVTTCEGGIPDIVKDKESGVIVRQKNSTEIADAIEYLLVNPSIKENFGNESKRRYDEMFTLRHFESRIDVIFSELIDTSII